MSEGSELDAISDTKQTLQIFTFLKNVSCILTYMKKTSFHILRVGLAVTFLWSWPFKFDIAGNWKYHDHLSPKNFGAIIVK